MSDDTQAQNKVDAAREFWAAVREAQIAISKLSNRAKALGLDSTMYALNRAWHELYNERERSGSDHAYTYPQDSALLNDLLVLIRNPTTQTPDVLGYAARAAVMRGEPTAPKPVDAIDAPCGCTHEHGDSDCARHPTCPGCGEALDGTQLAAEVRRLRESLKCCEQVYMTHTNQLRADLAEEKQEHRATLERLGRVRAALD